MNVTVQSFGFKHGMPEQADLLFDARFLPNPYYVDAMRERTGQDADVRAYVLDNQTGREFLERLTELLAFVLPQYAASGREQLTLAVGCTGGRHRSVAVAETIFRVLGTSREWTIAVCHRDLEKQ